MLKLNDMPAAISECCVLSTFMG